MAAAPKLKAITEAIEQVNNGNALTGAAAKPVFDAVMASTGEAIGALSENVRAPLDLARSDIVRLQLVDLLQCLQRQPFEAKPMKVALVVSAWDLAPDGGTDAEKWLKDRYPLLAQFLANSEGILDLRVRRFGPRWPALEEEGWTGTRPREASRDCAREQADPHHRPGGGGARPHPAAALAGRPGVAGLSTPARDSIDQALFGYADGHRQIASSVRLPPKDLYLLSSASDLASGARLGEGDSYLSGLPLPE
jgi:Double-GTPase 1